MSGRQQGSCDRDIVIHRETKAKNRPAIRVCRLEGRSGSFPKLREILTTKVVIHQSCPGGEAVVNLDSLTQKSLGIVKFLFHLGAKCSSNPKTRFQGTELSRGGQFIVRVESRSFEEFPKQSMVLGVGWHQQYGRSQ